MKTVAKFSMPSEAHVAVSRLHSAGIHAFIRDEATLQMNWLWSNAILGLRVEVPEEEFEASLEILNLEPSESGLVTFPFCGSDDITFISLTAPSAMAILFNFVLPEKRPRVNCNQCNKSHRTDRISGGK
ncbi:MAG: putative signal transducing protein [Verrucomicrobiia bacterium]|tara:strand:+ start:6020 stop:6406 length:387 start_codon:yes stop_codon:yes gene_type:complete